MYDGKRTIRKPSRWGQEVAGGDTPAGLSDQATQDEIDQEGDPVEGKIRQVLRLKKRWAAKDVSIDGYPRCRR
jgi:hypothetical protein